MQGRSPAQPENRAVVLRIEPLRVSPLRASIPRPGQRHRFRWPDGHRASTVRRWRTPGKWCGHERRCMSAGLAEGQRRSYMGDGSLREPSPIRQGIGGRAVKDKNRNPEGTPDFFLDGAAAARGRGKKINSQYVNITG